jgi:hypothetical protein
VLVLKVIRGNLELKVKKVNEHKQYNISLLAMRVKVDTHLVASNTMFLNFLLVTPSTVRTCQDHYYINIQKIVQ